eukprot:SAG31_NODE_930_length_10920_cov_4.478329_5_plen_148_part_00
MPGDRDDHDVITVLHVSRQIQEIHAIDLQTTYSYQGLDLTELFAVYGALPTSFQTSEQEEWRSGLFQRLVELTEREEQNLLTDAERCANCGAQHCMVLHVEAHVLCVCRCHPAYRLRSSSSRIQQLKKKLNRLGVAEIRRVRLNDGT